MSNYSWPRATIKICDHQIVAQTAEKMFYGYRISLLCLLREPIANLIRSHDLDDYGCHLSYNSSLHHRTSGGMPSFA